MEPAVTAMNKGDCFVLDVDHTIYLYVGEKAGHAERLKAISVANKIRDQDHNGRGNVEIIGEYTCSVILLRQRPCMFKNSFDLTGLAL